MSSMEKQPTILEKAALAAEDAVEDALRKAEYYGEDGPYLRDTDIQDIARAVLLAIREPSERMIEEGYDSYDANGGSIRDAFMDMIDAALVSDGGAA